MPLLRRTALPIFLAAFLPAAAPCFAQNVVDYAVIKRIVGARCRVCHTAVPQEDGLNATSQPPKGVKFDSPADVQKFASAMMEQAVKTRTMPPDNATHMTDAERETLGNWIAAGAAIP